MSAQPRALVTDVEQRSALAACRGLADAGYHVAGVGPTRLALGLWSRATKERIVLPDPRNDASGYVDLLLDVLHAGEYDVVVPGSEASLLPISLRRDEVSRHAALALPAHEDVLRALDKTVLAREAEAVGLAPPRSIACATLDEARAAARELGFPVVAKPTRSFRDVDGRLRQHSARVLQDESALPRAIEDMGTPIAMQQYVVPRILSCAGVRVDGRILGFTFVRYTRTFPPTVGSASLARTVDRPDGLDARIEELVARLRWNGLFELEFLELPGGGFGAIDFNPRPFGWLSLAIEAGANLPAIWCDHVLGREPRARDARTGYRYRWEDGDARHFLWQLRRGKVGAAVAVLRPHRRVVHPHFRLRDPGPLFARALTMLA